MQRADRSAHRRRSHAGGRAEDARMRILTLCGSLRGSSSNRSVLRAFGRLAPATISVEHYAGIGTLPHFNPDLDCEDKAPPHEVVKLRRAIGEAAAVVISTPEYAHGL